MKNNNTIANVEHANYEWSLKEVSDLINTVDIDTHFQSPARWSKDHMQAYLHNLFSGLAPSKFLFADVRECLKNNEINKSKIDIDYYSGWKNRGIRYLNVDGNNRFTTIKKFFNDEVKLSPGTYYINRVDDSTPGERFNDQYNVVRIKADKTWSELDNDVKQFILGVKIIADVYTKSTRAQLSELFLAVNSGMPLNDAEKRNAIISDISKMCREMGEKYYLNKNTASSVFRMVFTSKGDTKYNRRLVDAWFTHCAYVRNNTLNVRWNPQLLQDSYQSGTSMDKSTDLFHKSISEFFDKWVEPNAVLFNMFGKKVKKPSVNVLFDLYILKVTSYKHIKTVDDINNFVAIYCKTVLELANGKTDYRIGQRTFTYKSLLRGHDYPKTNKRNQALLAKLEKKLNSKTPTVIDAYNLNTPGRKIGSM